MNLENSGSRTGGAPLRLRLGTPEMRGSGRSELNLIAAVNETVRDAIAASESISLIAVNASLAAGRAGDRALGFRVVAGELRRFSEHMAADMAGWSALIYGVVRETALGRRQAHLMYKLQEASSRSEKAKVAIAEACKLSRTRLDETTARGSVGVHELLALIRRSEKQHLRGGMIARSALIEAAYGGEMQGMLRQIATTIGESMARFAGYGERVGKLLRRVVA